MRHVCKLCPNVSFVTFYVTSGLSHGALNINKNGKWPWGFMHDASSPTSQSAASECSCVCAAFVESFLGEYPRRIINFAWAYARQLKVIWDVGDGEQGQALDIRLLTEAIRTESRALRVPLHSNPWAKDIGLVVSYAQRELPPCRCHVLFLAPGSGIGLALCDLPAHKQDIAGGLRYFNI